MSTPKQRLQALLAAGLMAAGLSTASRGGKYQHEGNGHSQ